MIPHAPRTQHPADAPAARQSHATATAGADVGGPAERPAVADSAKAPHLVPALPERPSVSELALRGRRRPPLRAPGPTTCVLCEDARPHRRGLCWSCYRKLREANLPLPLRRCDEPGDPLLAWLGMLKPRQLVKLRGALRATLKPKRRATREVIDNGQIDLPGGER